MFIVFTTGWSVDGSEELVAVNLRDRMVKVDGHELRAAYDPEHEGQTIARLEPGPIASMPAWQLVEGIGLIDADAADFAGSRYAGWVVYDEEPEWAVE